MRSRNVGSKDSGILTLSPNFPLLPLVDRGSSADAEHPGSPTSIFLVGPFPNTGGHTG